MTNFEIVPPPPPCPACGGAGVDGIDLGSLTSLAPDVAQSARRFWLDRPCAVCRPGQLAEWNEFVGGCPACNGIGFVNRPPLLDPSIKKAELRWQLWAHRCPECVPERRARCPKCYGIIEANGSCRWCDYRREAE
jgi:hypothetical protein